MLVAERRSISRIVFVRHTSTSIHRVRCRMYSTKHRQSSKRSSRDSDFTNQHQPSLSVTPIVPQHRSHTYQCRLPFDGNPSLRRRRPAKRVSQPSQASSRARTTGSASGNPHEVSTPSAALRQRVLCSPGRMHVLHGLAGPLRYRVSTLATASCIHPSASHSGARRWKICK